MLSSEARWATATFSVHTHLPLVRLLYRVLADKWQQVPKAGDELMGTKVRTETSLFINTFSLLIGK